MEFYGMFDYRTGDTDTYEYNSAEFSALIEAITGTGISFAFGNRFDYSYSGLSVTLQSGAVFVKGRYAYNTAAETVAVEPVASGSSRTDTICAVLDEANRIISLEAVQGTSGAAPTLTDNQVPICNVVVNYGSGGASIASITDARSYVYTNSTVPSAQIIYSATQPTVVNGAIWLQPQE